MNFRNYNLKTGDMETYLNTAATKHPYIEKNTFSSLKKVFYQQI